MTSCKYLFAYLLGCGGGDFVFGIGFVLLSTSTKSDIDTAFAALS